jgi:hypothetical protein
MTKILRKGINVFTNLQLSKKRFKIRCRKLEKDIKEKFLLDIKVIPISSNYDSIRLAKKVNGAWETVSFSFNDLYNQ